MVHSRGTRLSMGALNELDGLSAGKRMEAIRRMPNDFPVPSV